MAPVLNLFGIEIPSYTLMLLVGFAAGYIAVGRRGSLYNIRPDELAATYLLGAVGAFIGGKTFYIIQGLPQFLQTRGATVMSFIEYIGQAGLVFYGGMFGCILFIALAARAFGTSVNSSMSTVLPALPLAQCFGRVGCLLAGCCYGMPSSFGVFLPGSDTAPHDVRLFPIQLAESACTLAIFFVMRRLSSTQQPPGRMLGTYLFWYGTARFVLEFFRYDAIRGSIGVLSVSQWISIGVLIWGAVLLSRARARSSGSETICVSGNTDSSSI